MAVLPLKLDALYQNLFANDKDFYNIVKLSNSLGDNS